jgi:hypothetical protein
MVVLLLSCAAVAFASDADVYFGTDREALFQSYAATIRDGQYLSAEGFHRLDTTWEKELEKAHRRFLDAKTKQDVYYALLSLKNSYHDMHCRLSVPDALEPKGETAALPLKFRPARVGSKLEFVVEWSRLPGVEKGDALKSYDGKSPEELLATFTEWEVGNSPERREFEFARWLTVRDPKDAPPSETSAVELVLRDGKGREASARAEFSPRRREESSPAAEPSLRDDADYAGWTPDFTGLNYRVYADTASGTLVLRDSSFWYGFSEAELWNRLRLVSYKTEPIWERGSLQAHDDFERVDMERLGDYLKSRNAQFGRLLVDVRENGGGPIAQRLTEFVADKPYRATWSVTRLLPLLRRDAQFRDAAYPRPYSGKAAMTIRELESGAELASPHAFICKTDDCGPREGDGKPSALGLHYKTALLTGPYCVSSCDQFAAVFLDNGFGPVVGLPPAGASSPSRADVKLKLADGEEFSLGLSFGITYRPNGEVLEGNPARPTKTLYPGPNYLRRVLDSLR